MSTPRFSEKLSISSGGPLIDPNGNDVESTYMNKTLYLQLGLCSAAFTSYDSTAYYYAAIYDCPHPNGTGVSFFEEQFRQSVRGYAQSRQCYNGVWNVTSANMTLVSAARLPDSMQRSCNDQSVMNAPGMQIDWLFPTPDRVRLDLVASTRKYRYVARNGSVCGLGSNGCHDGPRDLLYSFILPENDPRTLLAVAEQGKNE